MYRCNLCLLVMSDELQATKHVHQNYMAKMKVCEVPTCSFTSFNKILFMQHTLLHKIHNPPDMSRYKCKLCDYQSSHPACMEEHNKRYHKGSKEMCGQCKYCFFHSEDPQILAHHMHVRHKSKKSKFTKKHFGPNPVRN